MRKRGMAPHWGCVLTVIVICVCVCSVLRLRCASWAVKTMVSRARAGGGMGKLNCTTHGCGEGTCAAVWLARTMMNANDLAARNRLETVSVETLVSCAQNANLESSLTRDSRVARTKHAAKPAPALWRQLPDVAQFFAMATLARHLVDAEEGKRKDARRHDAPGSRMCCCTVRGEGRGVRVIRT